MEQQPERSGDPMRKRDTAPEVRVSDRERDAAVDILAAALTEGRLLPQEHADRVGAALRARTAGELAALTADLPAPRPDKEERKRKELAEWYAEWRYWLGGALVLSVIWGVNCLSDGELQFYWPVTPLGIWAAVLLAAAFRPGNGKDDDTA
ncbi:DUF1707 SHOCT-like domain-containing protein [Streptomyces sp. NPDC004779]|uniref:DUF1707 SHOCT-like domain-containing protein n=1 Tax=Streptomyces sp. NPDC056049 TaxID=3345693 RepID=UPI0035DC98DD